MAHVAFCTLRHRICLYLNYSNLFFPGARGGAHVAFCTLRYRICLYLNHSNLFFSSARGGAHVAFGALRCRDQSVWINKKSPVWGIYNYAAAVNTF